MANYRVCCSYGSKDSAIYVAFYKAANSFNVRVSRRSKDIVHLTCANLLGSLLGQN
jgi:hypothetical protein